MLPFETVSTANKTEYSVIWLHGLGADGNDFVPIVPELKLPASLAVKFIFPHAPVRPITLNNGYQMRAWFALDEADNAKEEDILTSVGWIHQLLDKEVESGVPAKNIILAGFSQGGVIAIQAGLRYAEKLAGIMMLSTYIPFQQNLFKVITAKHKNLPVFAAHGINDPVIPVKSWQNYVPALKAQDLDVEAHSYPMEHSVCQQEIADISAWLQRVLA